MATRIASVVRVGAALVGALGAMVLTVVEADAAKTKRLSWVRGAIAAHQDEPKVVDVELPGGMRIRTVDWNRDGNADTVLCDWNGDGSWDAGVNHRNRDGGPDSVWVDRNGDGKPQAGEVQPLPGPRQARLEACPGSSPSDSCAASVSDPAACLACPGSTESTDPWHGQPGRDPNACTPVDGGCGPIDVDGDGEGETIRSDPAVVPNNSGGVDTDGDRDPDDVVVGTKGGGGLLDACNVDNDPKDAEAIIEDPNTFPNNSYGLHADGDGDHDLIAVGTKGGAKFVGCRDLDGDPSEQEVVIEDPNILPANSYGVDLDGDGDDDVKVIGTKS